MFGEILHSINLGTMLVGLTVLLVAASEIATFIRCRVPYFQVPKGKDGVSDFTSSTVLGLLALLLGFTFSMAITRYEARKNIVVREANAFGTAYLRSKLVDHPQAQELRQLLEVYLSERIADYRWTAETQSLQGQIWQVVTNVTAKDRSAVSSLLVDSLNAVFDIRAEAEFACSNHVPEIIYYVIIIVAIVGIASQGHGRLSALFLAMLVSIVIVLIQDLDRPTGGFIQVSQSSLLDLQKALFH